VLDKLIAQEKLSIEQSELVGYITAQAARRGVPADRLARDLTGRGQLSSVATDLLRSKAMTLLAERARVSDASGRPVDVRAIVAETEGARPAGAAEDAQPAGLPAEGRDPRQSPAARRRGRSPGAATAAAACRHRVLPLVVGFS
jgi:trigger factor